MHGLAVILKSMSRTELGEVIVPELNAVCLLCSYTYTARMYLNLHINSRHDRNSIHRSEVKFPFKSSDRQQGSSGFTTVILSLT